ncbi:MAG: agmatinase [Planctomycetes bacterium]|nr:agmatinase [Planctomycetota bacterium]
MGEEASGPHGAFLGLPAARSAPARSRVAVLPIPFERTTSYGKGTRRGPAALIDASRQVELWDEVLEQDSSRVGVTTLAPVRATAVEAMLKQSEAATARVLAEGKFVISLGGEHTVTEGPLRAFVRRHPSISVLHIDAHADLRATYEGNRRSHACAASRMLDCGIRRLVSVGVRNLSDSEWPRRKDPRVRIHFAHRIRRDRSWIRKAVAQLFSPVYVTIDLDGLDPSWMPGVGTPEPGGLDWWQVTDLMTAVARRHRVVGMDVVELMPIPGQKVSEFNAARLTYRLIGLFVK